jgi:hypothetical protein
MKKPTQCVLWHTKNITPRDLNLELLKVYMRTAHIERDLFKCRECGQLYFHEWYEHVSFKHDAYMYDTYIPIENEEEAQKLLETMNSAELAQFVPQLHGSFTNDDTETLKWYEEAPKD